MKPAGVWHEGRRGTARSVDLARHYLQQRELRSGVFGIDLFREPAWDIMLELFCARLTGREVGVMEACAAAGVPSTTGLRYVERLLKNGVITRCRDADDRRRSWVELSEEAAAKVEAWLHTTWPNGC